MSAVVFVLIPEDATLFKRCAQLRRGGAGNLGRKRRSHSVKKEHWPSTRRRRPGLSDGGTRPKGFDFQKAEPERWCVRPLKAAAARGLWRLACLACARPPAGGAAAPAERAGRPGPCGRSESWDSGRGAGG